MMFTISYQFHQQERNAAKSCRGSNDEMKLRIKKFYIEKWANQIQDYFKYLSIVTLSTYINVVGSERLNDFLGKLILAYQSFLILFI